MLMALPSGASSLLPIAMNAGGGRLRGPSSDFVDVSPELPQRKYSRIAEVRSAAWPGFHAANRRSARTATVWMLVQRTPPCLSHRQLRRPGADD